MVMLCLIAYPQILSVEHCVKLQEHKLDTQTREPYRSQHGKFCKGHVADVLSGLDLGQVLKDCQSQRLLSVFLHEISQIHIPLLPGTAKPCRCNLTQDTGNAYVSLWTAHARPQSTNNLWDSEHHSNILTKVTVSTVYTGTASCRTLPACSWFWLQNTGTGPFSGQKLLLPLPLTSE